MLSPVDPQLVEAQPVQVHSMLGQSLHAQPVQAQTVQVQHMEQPQAQLQSVQPLPAQREMAQTQQQAGTFVNIAIQDAKDFPSDIASMQELYSEFTMTDGSLLFECQNLVKATGIDLMNCPLSIGLHLRVRKRIPQGAVVLWHLVLPLSVISKYLLGPPHEWETWIGLFPNTQRLDAHPPDTMFAQAVHLISRPEFPKLRLRFRYHNPELQAQLSAQREVREQESRRRTELTQQVGRAQFEEIQKLTSTLRGDNAVADREGAASTVTPVN